MTTEPTIRINLMVDGKAVELSQFYSIEFEQAPDLSIRPVLHFKCKRVNKQWSLRAVVWIPEEGE